MLRKSERFINRGVEITKDHNDAKLTPIQNNHDLYVDMRMTNISQILDSFYSAFGKDHSTIQRSDWETAVTNDLHGTTYRTYKYPPTQLLRSYANDRWRITESDHWLYGPTYFIAREITKGGGKKIINIMICRYKTPSYQEVDRVVDSGTSFHPTDYSYKESFQATGSDTVTLIADEHNNAAVFPLILRAIRDIPKQT